MYNNESYIYFIYSKMQHNSRKEIEKTIGKNFIPGKVLVNGNWSYFTEMSTKSFSRYSDAKIVAEGKISDIKYQLPSSN